MKSGQKNAFLMLVSLFDVFSYIFLNLAILDVNSLNVQIILEADA